MTKTKGVAAVESHDSNKEESPGTLTADEKSPEKQQTYAERVNEWISWGADIALRSVLFEIRKLTVTISGVDSKTFKEAHKTLSPNEANVMFARLPRHRRALTVFGADVISLSFSPCDQCNALLCFVGLHTKVGMPALFDQPEGDAVTPPVSIDLEYAWHMITHLRDLAVEVKGTKDIITWASNYDHYWHTKRLDLIMSTTELEVSLSPDHLHTALLHLDDYAGATSPFNEWYEWLKSIHHQTLETSDDEKEAYRNNYARIKGAKTNGGKGPDSRKPLALSQMKDIERRMTRYEIMSLRCFAMESFWQIPEENKDLEQFLLRSRSSICAKGDEGCATSVDAPTPFQRQYPARLHALASLIRETNSVLTPHITVKWFAKILHIDFLDTKEESLVPSIPSSITFSRVSFDIDQHNILSVDTDIPAELDSPRPSLDLSLQISGCKWDMMDTVSMSVKSELPKFRGVPMVQLVYMVSLLAPNDTFCGVGLVLTNTHFCCRLLLPMSLRQNRAKRLCHHRALLFLLVLPLQSPLPLSQSNTMFLNIVYRIWSW